MVDVCLKIVIGGRCNPINNSGNMGGVLVIDGLTSTSKEHALSANQGRLLAWMISEIDLSSKLYKSIFDNLFEFDDQNSILKIKYPLGFIQFLQGFTIGISTNPDGTPSYVLHADGTARLKSITLNTAEVQTLLTAFDVFIQNKLTAASAEITGLLKADRAEIAGLLKAASAEIAESLKAGSADITTVLKTPSLTSFTFVPGFIGSGYRLSTDAQGITELEIDKLLVRKSMTAASALIQGLLKAASAEIAGSLKAGSADITTVLKTPSLTSFTFVPGFLGSGYKLSTDAQGITELEIDKLLVRKSMTVYELIKHKISHVGGAFLFSPASAEITKVTDGGTYYRCEVKEKENNFFTAGALALCQIFNSNALTYKRYWRAVTSVSADGSYVNLSKADCEAGSAAPEAGDTIVQLGHKTNTALQHARLISSYGSDGAYDQFLEGINSYSLVGKVMQQIGRDTFFNVNSLKIKSGGVPHQTPVDKGMWIAGKYFYYDRVHHAGSWWICTAVYTDAEPGTNSEWQRQSERSSSYAELNVEKDRITTLVNKQAETEGSLSDIQSSITQMAGSIESKVSQTEYDTDKDANSQTVSQIQSSISQLAGSIESKVSQTEYDTDKDANSQTVSQIQSSISQLAGSIESKVSQTEYDTDKDANAQEVSQIQSSITQMAGSISSKVSQTEYNAEQQAVQIQMSAIDQKADSISLKVSQVNVGSANLIENSDFSKGVEKWVLNMQPDFSVLRKGDEPDGDGIEISQISTYSGLYSQIIPLNTSNTISFWVKRETGSNFNMEVKIGTTSGVGTTVQTIPVSSNWVKVEFPYNMEASAGRNIQFYTTSGNVMYRIIDLRINEIHHNYTWSKLYTNDTVTHTAVTYGLPYGASSAGRFFGTQNNNYGPWMLWKFPTERKYTLSFFVRSNLPNSLLFGYESDIQTIPTTTKWQLVKYTFESKESDPNKNIVFYQRYAGHFWLTNIMLVEGENAAHWQPNGSEIKNDLLATGIDIEKKKVTVTADTFILRDNNGVERAVFNENFKLDAFGNMTINSLRTPFARVTNFSTHNFDQYPNAVFVPPAGTGTLTLPNLEKHNGLTINLLFDAFYDSWSTATAVREIWKLQGFFMDQNGNRYLDMPLHRMERTFLSITGIWTGSRIMWVVRDRISHIVKASFAPNQDTWLYSDVPELIKAGDLVCAGMVNEAGLFVEQDSRLIGNFAVSKLSNEIALTFPAIQRVNASGAVSSFNISNSDFHINVTPCGFNRFASAYYNSPYRAFYIYNYSAINMSQYVFGEFTFEIRALKDFHQLYNL